MWFLTVCEFELTYSRAIRVTAGTEIHHLNGNECAKIRVVQPQVHSLVLTGYLHLSKCISSNNSKCRWPKPSLSRAMLRYVPFAVVEVGYDG